MVAQKGFVPIAIIIAIVVAVLAGGGYFLASKNGTAPALPIGPTLNPNCKFNDPDLCKFVNNWKDIKNYSVKSTSTSKEGKFDSLVEISGQDKFHMVTSENNKESYNVITIGDTTYTKNYSDNTWWKQKQDKQVEDLKSKIEFKVEDNKDTQQVEDKTTYKALGKEACGSRNCFKYQVITPDAKSLTEYIWFDDKEYLLRKSRTEDQGIVDEAEYSYDRINISEPSPVKEIKAGEAVVPGGGIIPGFSAEDSKKIQEESKKTIDAQPKDYQIQPVIDSNDSSEADNSDSSAN